MTGVIGLSLLLIAVTIGIANIFLLLLLIRAYWKTYKQVKSGFTIGLLYFSTFLLLQNLVTTFFLALPLFVPVSVVGVNVPELHGPRLPLFLINVVQLVALSTLFKITRE